MYIYVYTEREREREIERDRDILGTFTYIGLSHLNILKICLYGCLAESRIRSIARSDRIIYIYIYMYIYIHRETLHNI